MFLINVKIHGPENRIIGKISNGNRAITIDIFPQFVPIGDKSPRPAVKTKFALIQVAF